MEIIEEQFSKTNFLNPVNNQEDNDLISETINDVISEVEEQKSITHGINTIKEENYGQIKV